jgi:hypothetical protein
MPPAEHPNRLLQMDTPRELGIMSEKELGTEEVYS